MADHPVIEAMRAAHAAPLCGYHHRRVHDTQYEHECLPDGSIRFRHKWPSRWKNGADPWFDQDGQPSSPNSNPSRAA